MAKPTNTPADEYVIYRVTMDVAVPTIPNLTSSLKLRSVMDYIDTVGSATILGSYEESLCLQPARTVARSASGVTGEWREAYDNYPPHND